MHNFLKLLKVNFTIVIFICKQYHGWNLWVLYILSKVLEHFFELIEPDRLFVQWEEELKQFFEFFLIVICIHILLFEKLNELILLHLPTTISIDLINQILSLRLIHLYLTCFQYFHDFWFVHSSWTVDIKLHEYFSIFVIFFLLLTYSFGFCHFEFLF